MTDAGFTVPDAYIWQSVLPGKIRVPENNRPYTPKAIYKVIHPVLKRVELEGGLSSYVVWGQSRGRSR